MKKILNLTIILVLFISLSGCKLLEKSFEVKTEKISIYTGQNFKIDDFLEYSDNLLENTNVKIISGDVDVATAGIYNVIVEVTADNRKNATKEIEIEVKNFESEDEVSEYANNIILQNGYENLKCSVQTGKQLNIGDIKFSKSLETDIFATFKFRLKTGTSLLSMTTAQNILAHSNENALSKSNYFICLMLDIEKENVAMDSSNYYKAKSIQITSDKGTYEFYGNDSLVFGDREHSSNKGDIFEPKYDFTSSIGYNLYDLDKFIEVMEGNNITLKVDLYKGLEENEEETESFEVSLDEEKRERIMELIEFMKKYIYEYSK